MKNKKIDVKIVIIIVLIGIIITLIMINLNNKNNNIKQQLIEKEQLGETTEDDTYVSMERHTLEVHEKEQKLVSFKSAIANTITELGVETSQEADENVMSSNIRTLSDKPNVIEQSVTVRPSTYGQQCLTFTFDKLQEVLGLKSFVITNKTSGDTVYFYINYGSSSGALQITGNTVKIWTQTYKAPADFTITATGYEK